MGDGIAEFNEAVSEPASVVATVGACFAAPQLRGIFSASMEMKQIASGGGGGGGGGGAAAGNDEDDNEEEEEEEGGKRVAPR